MATVPTSVVLRPAAVDWAVIDARVVVRRPEGGPAHVLDPTSSLLWQCLDGEATLAELFADVADVAGVATQRVSDDCRLVVQSWIAAGIATTSPVPSEPSGPPRAWRHLLPPPNG
jgi:hypothetical protein